MIEISRSLLRTVRSVFRRAGIGKTPPGLNSLLQVQAANDGLRVRGNTHDVVIEYHQAGKFSTDQVSVPFQLIEDCHGSRDQPVRLEAIDNIRVTAAWTDKSVPHLIEYRLDKRPVFQFPALPEQFQGGSSELLPALRTAGATTETCATRYALACVQLSGSSGQIAATDGRQAYWHRGLAFPWKGDLLLPYSAVWKSAEFTEQSKWEIGQSGDWITLRGGPWTVWQRIEKEGRFPRLDDVVPKPDAEVARLQIGPGDARFLGESLCKLPCHDEQHMPVTLDLNGQVAIRAKDVSGRITEVRLAQSQYSGEALTISINRKYLERAVQLGFRELAIFGAGHLVLCNDDQRQLLWMLLEANDLIAAQADMVRISSAGEGSANSVPTVPSASRPIPRQRSHIPVPQPQTQDRPVTQPEHPVTSAAHPTAIPSPIQQAADLLVSLQEAARQTRLLIASLRHQKRQTQLVKSTLASLQQLKNVA